MKVIQGAECLGSFSPTALTTRRFCTRCGSQVMAEHPTLGVTSVYAARIPEVAFAPTVHLNDAEAVLPIPDGLPKLRAFPATAGGSGMAMPA